VGGEVSTSQESEEGIEVLIDVGVSEEEMLHTIGPHYHRFTCY
jgi:hypothetical protein